MAYTNEEYGEQELTQTEIDAIVACLRQFNFDNQVMFNQLAYSLKGKYRYYVETPGKGVPEESVLRMVHQIGNADRVAYNTMNLGLAGGAGPFNTETGVLPRAGQIGKPSGPPPPPPPGGGTND